MGRVLVVDDDSRVAEAMRRVLAAAGHDVAIARGGFEALEMVERQHPDLMVLDFRMPDLDGIDVLAELRDAEGSTPFPVLVFTSEAGHRYGELAGLQAGAVDYVRKGADTAVVLARVEAALRRFSSAPPQRRVLLRGPLRIDLDAARVSLAGREVDLEARPYALLVYLAERDGTVVSRAEVLAQVWGTDYAGFAHAVDQAVYEVRKTLRDSRWIQTVPRIGYRFQVP